MAPRADGKLEFSPSGIRRNTHKDHAQNLPSPWGSKVGPSGPYKSWHTWPQKHQYSPSGSQAGPSGPHNTSHKQHDQKHETKKDPPIQPEVPHRRRRGAKNNTDIIKTRRGIQSQSQGLNQHNSRKNKLLMVLLLECFFKLEMHRDCSSILGCLAFHAACPELQQLQNKYTKYGPI